MGNDVLIVVKGEDRTSGAFKSADTGAHNLANTMRTAITGGALVAGAGLGAAAVAAFKFAGAASNMDESLSKSNVVFGQSAKGIEDWSKNAARNFGQSRREAIEMAATFGNLFSALGIGQKEAAGLSTRIVELASDLASFNNIPIDDALVKLRAGLVGEAEPLRTLGVQLTEATVRAKAMGMGLADASGELSEGAKVQARYALIMEQTKNAQGDFARTADGAANSQRILAATWEDTKVTLGQIMLPLLKEGSKELSSFLVDHQDDIEAFSQAFAKKVPEAFQLTAGAVQVTADAMVQLGEAGKSLSDIADELTGAAIPLAAALTFLFPGQALVTGILAVHETFAILDSDVTKASDSALTFEGAWLAAADKVLDSLVEVEDGLLAIATLGLSNIVDFGDTAASKAQAAIKAKRAAIGEEQRSRLPSLDVLESIAMHPEAFKAWIDGVAAAERAARRAAAGLTDTLVPSLGGATGGGGVTGAAQAARASLIDMALAFADFHAATGLGEQDFMALIQMSEHRADLDKRATEAGVALATAQLEATDGAFQLKKGLVAMAEKAVELGGSMPKAIEAALRGVTDNIRNAFNGLFNRPTKEGAELDLEIAILEEQLAKKKAAGASEQETKGLEASIESLRNRKDVLDRHANVLKAQIEVADHTLLTEQGRDFAAQLYTIALGDASTELDSASALVSLQSIAQANYIDALSNAAAALGGADLWTDDMKRWVNGVARGKGEEPPFPGFDTGGRVTRTGLAVVHAGEVVQPAGKAPLGDVIHHHNYYIDQVVLHGDGQAGLSALGVSL